MSQFFQRTTILVVKFYLDVFYSFTNNLTITILLRQAAEKKPIAKSKNANENFDDIPVVDISKVLSLSEKQKLKSTDWAEIIDVSSSLENFNDLVPNPAFTWPFELDRFQKHVQNLQFYSTCLQIFNKNMYVLFRLLFI